MYNFLLKLRVVLLLGTGLLLSVVPSSSQPPPAQHTNKPNIVIIFADDLGYGDVGCYGAKKIRTPNIDRLAARGTRYTDFYVSQAVCTASRASLLTGCYANRVGLQGALNHTSKEGLHKDETTMAEMLKANGYATAIFGKWHLGTKDEFNPLYNGFDEYLGIPYSNDNSKYHPVIRTMPPLPLYDGERVVETDPDQSLFTKRFTERAVSFIERHRERPFFLYVPHVMPHVPIFASEKFRGKSAAGLYGDVVEELDASVGTILATLRKNGLEKNTLVIFMSDNGPFLSYGDHAGSAGPLREGKLTTFDGGQRVPFIAYWPGRVPAGKVRREPLMSIDLLPTIAELTGARLPERKLDGQSFRGLLLGAARQSKPQQAYFLYNGEELQAVRSGRWKLHFAHKYLVVNGTPGTDGKPANYANMKPVGIERSGIDGIASRHGYKVEDLEPSLFDMQTDKGERKNVAAKYPAIVERLSGYAAAMRKDLGDTLTGAKGNGVRAVGRAQ